MKISGLFALVLAMVWIRSASPIFAAQSSGKKSVKKEAVKIDSSADPDEFIATPSTRIDFSETAIDGKMKAPEGFMLQGQQGNSLSQMVKLRSNFRNQLNNSRSATKALVK